MLNVKKSYKIKKKKSTNLYLISILNFGEDFGFLFSKKKNESMMGSSYIKNNKKTKDFSLLPTTPDNIKKMNDAKKISLMPAV